MFGISYTNKNNGHNEVWPGAMVSNCE